MAVQPRVTVGRPRSAAVAPLITDRFDPADAVVLPHGRVRRHAAAAESPPVDPRTPAAVGVAPGVPVFRATVPGRPGTVEAGGGFHQQGAKARFSSTYARSAPHVHADALR